MEIEFWETASGRCPVKEFTDRLPEKHRIKILKRQDYLSEKGFFLLNTPFVKKLSGSVYELIVDFDRIGYRLLWGVKNGVCWMVHIFLKKQQKTPQKEINIAEARLKTII